MKMSVLEITQNILSAIDGEEVSSIHDTVESLQVAEEIRTTYYEQFGHFEIKSRFQLIKLEALQDTDNHPNILKINDEIDHFEWFKYNTGTELEPVWIDLCYLEPRDFFEHVVMNTEGSLEKVLTIDSLSPYQIRNDKDPQYWTTFDDTHVVLDSYNSDKETTIQTSKSLVFAEVLPEFLLNDSFVPVLHSKDFPMLLAEAKSACFINVKGVSSSKEEQRSRRQKVQRQNNRARYNEEDQVLRPEDFGRS